MRIALASIHPRALSGQIESLVGLAQGLEEDGHSVKVISAFPDEQLLSQDRLRLVRDSTRILFDQPLRITRITRRLARIAPEMDLIQLNLPTPAFSIYSDLVQALVPVPVVVGYEAHLVRARELLRSGRLAQSPAFFLPRLVVNNRLVARLTFRCAAHYVVNTQYQREELLSLGTSPERIAVIPNVLPRDKMASNPERAAAPTRPGRRLITYVGHYNPVKGVDVLVRAFKLLAQRYPDLHLALAWSGIGAPKRVHALLKEPGLAGRVSELGHVQVPELMRESSVVVLPYRMTIGQAAPPATLLEAIAANVPIVTTDLPVLRELTDGGKTALLVPPDDAAALAAGIERLLSDGLLAQNMIAAQREWSQTIQPAQLVKEFEQLYTRVIEKRKASILLPAAHRERV